MKFAPDVLSISKVGPSSHVGGAFHFRSLSINAPINSSVNATTVLRVITLRKRKNHARELLAERVS